MPTLAEIREKFPMYSDLPDAQLLAGLHKTYYGDMSTGDFLKKIDFSAKPGQAAQQAADSMGPWERGLANVGAGMANLGQGAQQLASKIGLGKGPSDDEIQDKRARDEALAGEGLGGKALQIAGEVLPTLVLPGAAMARPFQALGPVSSFLAGSAAAGAAGAALQPVTSDESRGTNMAMAAGLGAVVPGAGQVGGKVLKQTARLLSSSGAKTRALEALAEYVPGSTRQAIADSLEKFKAPKIGPASPEIPTTAAQATGDAGLAQAEAASRANPGTAPDWQRFDAGRNADLYQTVGDLAPSDLRMQRLESVRTGRTAPLRDQALADATARGNVAYPVMNHAEQLLAGDTGALPGVQRLASFVKNNVGPDATPGRLYEARKYLTSLLQGPAILGDEMSAAAKGSQRETMGLINSIDDAIAGGTKQGSTWGDYLQQYGARSAPITSGQVLRDTMATLAQKPRIAGIGGVPGSPEVTYNGLKQTVGKLRNSKKFGDRLTSDDSGDVGQLMDYLANSEAIGRARKISGTMGGGSQTNLDTQLGNFSDKVLKLIPGVGGYMTRLDDFGKSAVNEQMAKLLQNPQAFGEALKAMPSSVREQAIIDALRATNAAAGGAAGAALTP